MIFITDMDVKFISKFKNFLNLIELIQYNISQSILLKTIFTSSISFGNFSPFHKGDLCFD